MKKAYWFLISLIIVSAFLDVIFSVMELEIPMIVASVVMIIALIVELILYFGFVKFKCEKCNTIFKGKRLEIFFAPHTVTKRYMKCPVCNEKVWCEDYFGNLKNKENDNAK